MRRYETKENWAQYQSHIVKRSLRQFAVEILKNPRHIFESHNQLKDDRAIALLSDLLNFQGSKKNPVIYQ